MTLTALVAAAWPARPRGKERRAAPRALTWMKGSALPDAPRPAEHLVVVNYGTGGAKLRAEGGPVAKEFWIEIPARRELRRARATWRRDGFLGVTFLTEKLPSGLFRADVAARLQGFEGALLDEAQEPAPADRLARARAVLKGIEKIGRLAWRRASAYLRALRAA